MESDFRFEVTVSRWQPCHDIILCHRPLCFMQKSATLGCVFTKHLQQHLTVPDL